MKETMTDARALLVLQERRFERCVEYDEALDHIAARLRGEAAQPGNPACDDVELVMARNAIPSIYWDRCKRVIAELSAAPAAPDFDTAYAAADEGKQAAKGVCRYWYEAGRAAPAPVAGDAVAAVCVRCGDKPESVDSLNLTLSGLVAYGKVAGNPSQGATRWHLMDLVRQMVPHLEAALAQDRASQESEQSIKADAYDMIAEAVEKSGVRVTSIVDHVSGLIASQASAAGVPEDAVCPNCDRLTDIRHCKACGCDFVQDAALRTGGGEA